MLFLLTLKGCCLRLGKGVSCLPKVLQHWGVQKRGVKNTWVHQHPKRCFWSHLFVTVCAIGIVAEMSNGGSSNGGGNGEGGNGGGSEGGGNGTGNGGEGGDNVNGSNETPTEGIIL